MTDWLTDLPRGHRAAVSRSTRTSGDVVLGRPNATRHLHAAGDRELRAAARRAGEPLKNAKKNIL